MAADSTGVQVSRAGGSLSSSGAWFRAGVVAALLLFAYWGTIRHTLYGRWMSDGNWSHGPLIPLFSLYFLYLRRSELLQVRPRPSYLGAVVLAASLALYVISAWWFHMAYPQAVSLVGAIFGLTLLLGGWRVIRLTWFPIFFLLLAVPLPQSIYVEITRPLRILATSVSAAAMPLFVSGLHVEAQALVMDYAVPGQSPGTLNVEEACSGMRLTMAFVTLGLLMAYLGSRPMWQRVLLVLSCIPIAVFCNAIRVTVTGLMVVTGHESLARGTPHQLLGILMLGIALGLFALLRYMLSHLFVEESPEPGGEVEPG